MKRKRPSLVRRRAEGRCDYCESPALDGLHYCAEHREYHTAKSRRQKARYNRIGRCHRCPNKVIPGLRVCAAHAIAPPAPPPEPPLYLSAWRANRPWPEVRASACAHLDSMQFALWVTRNRRLIYQIVSAHN